MSRMFTYNGNRMTTWNLFTGCNFECSYCWARLHLLPRLMRNPKTPKYREVGFTPTTHPDRFDEHFSKNEFVFVSSMGDISFAPPEVVDQVVQTAKKYPQTKFLFCTKSPSVYLNRSFPENIYQGVTIETNRDYPISKAPTTLLRYNAMATLPGNKFLSIEPIMDFDYDIFLSWIKDINPQIVEIGADNYNYHLPEPSWNKVQALIDAMKSNGIHVIKKEKIFRLKDTYK